MFHFDKISTNQVKKHGYSTYFSLKNKEMLLYGGRYTADDMVVHFCEFMKKTHLNPNFMLSLGNKLSLNKLCEDIDTCLLHIFVSAFGISAKSPKESVVYWMVIDFHFFFKYSAAR